MMISEAFQYPTRLGRAAKLPGGSFVFGQAKQKSGIAKAMPLTDHLLLRPPRLPSMLRFRSEILPSEEDRNCFSLSSKDCSAETG